MAPRGRPPKTMTKMANAASSRRARMASVNITQEAG